MTGKWRSVALRFKDRTLPRSEWSHGAHLIVALWYLLEHKDVSKALCYLRPDIILYNHSLGGLNTESRGYHETVTVFWVKQLEKFVESEQVRDFDSLAEKLLGSPMARKDYILEFYNKEVLKSSEARGLYIAP